MNRFRCDTGLTGVDRARFDRSAQRRFEVCAWHHDECITAAQLEHTFFDFTRGRARDSRAGFFRCPSPLRPSRAHRRLVFPPVPARSATFGKRHLQIRRGKRFLQWQAHTATIRCVLKQADVAAIKAGAANRNTCQKGKFHASPRAQVRAVDTRRNFQPHRSAPVPPREIEHPFSA